MTVRIRPIFILTWCLLASHSVFAQVPNTFSPGAMARAEQVNENFTALDQRLAVLEPDRYSIDCSNDPQALQVHWDNIAASASSYVEYSILGICNFDYDTWGPRSLVIRGVGPANSKIVGSFYQSGIGNYLGLFDISVVGSPDVRFDGEIIRPERGATLELVSVQISPETTVSAQDAFTRVYVERSSIQSAFYLWGADLSVNHAQLSDLEAHSSRVYFHGGGLLGSLSLTNSRARFQTIGVPNGESYINGSAVLYQSDIVLAATVGGRFDALPGSSMTLEWGAILEDISLVGSQLTIRDASVASNQIELNLSTVYAVGDTTLNYVCDGSSHVVGDVNNVTAQTCR